MYLVSYAPTSAELHCADIHLIHLWGNDLSVPLFDQLARNPSPAQFARKRETNWAATDD